MATTTTTTSAVGTDIASLYESISNFQSEINAIEERHSQERTALEQKHKGELSEKNNEFNKAKASFASYLKQAGIDTLLAPEQAKGKGKQANLFGDAEKSTRSRKSSDEVKATLERNRAIYTSTYPNGVDAKTGLPIRFKGRSTKNEEIDALMKDDEREAAGKNTTVEAVKPTGVRSIEQAVFERDEAKKAAGKKK
jgi:hypothetical protein